MSASLSGDRKNQISGHVCPWQHAYLLDNFLRPLLHNPIKMFAPYVKPGMKALDVGCGRGFASLGLARLVGDTGTVIAFDVQPEMLKMVEQRAAKAKLSQRIKTHQCGHASIGLSEKFDFVLAFWMAHETPNPEGFLHEIYELLNPDGHFYLIEPKMHVSVKDFLGFLSQAESIGFIHKANPSIRLSRSAVMVRSNQD